MALLIGNYKFYPAYFRRRLVVLDMLNVTRDSFFKFSAVVFVRPEVY